MDPDLYESPPVTLVLPVSICIFPLSCRVHTVYRVLVSRHIHPYAYV